MQAIGVVRGEAFVDKDERGKDSRGKRMKRRSRDDWRMKRKELDAG